MRKKRLHKINLRWFEKRQSFDDAYDKVWADMIEQCNKQDEKIFRPHYFRYNQRAVVMSRRARAIAEQSK